MKNKIAHFGGLICILFLVTMNSVYSQSYAKVDDVIKSYPKSFSSPENLAAKINEDFKGEEEKARAIFTWIALNIKYDLNEYKSRKNDPAIAFSYRTEEEKNFKLQKFRFDLAKETLRSKKGVCQGYAALFHTLCDLTGLKSMEITGTSKSHPTAIGKLPIASDHAWNAVKIGDNWKFIDVTWASGAVSNQTGKFVSKFNDAYFFTAPDIFFLNHFPDDVRFLQTNKTAADFANLPLYYGGYLQAPYKIVYPLNGVIKTPKSNTIAFKIRDLPETNKLFYVFSSENILNLVLPRRKANTSEFDIKIPNRSKGYLTIYVNNRSIVTYKLD
jgi:hypothetical protein